MHLDAKVMRPILLLLLVLAAMAAVAGSVRRQPGRRRHCYGSAALSAPPMGSVFASSRSRRPSWNTGECYRARHWRRCCTSRRRGAPSPRRQTRPSTSSTATGACRGILRRGGVNINLELVRQGAAAPYFDGGDLGRYVHRPLSAAKAAKAARRGLWGACPGTLIDPYRAIETRQKDATPRGIARAAVVTFVPDGVHPAKPARPRLLRRAREANQGRRHGSARLRGDRDGVGCET